MELGCHAQDDIKETATKAKAAVLLLSPEFVTSEYTLEELSIFLTQKTFLVPIFGVVGPNDCSDCSRQCIVTDNSQSMFLVTAFLLLYQTTCANTCLKMAHLM